MMELYLLGTGAAWPDADRSAPAYLIINDGKPYLLDCGGGTSHQLMKIGWNPFKLETVLFSHTHIDHCVEFPSLVFGAYLTGKEGKFVVYGPKGTTHFTTSIFADTYDFASAMMKKLRNKDIVIDSHELESGIVLQDGNFKIECFALEHGCPTLGYRFSDDKKTLVICPDTAPCRNVVEYSKSADMLVIECSFSESVGIKPGHCIPSQVAMLAKESNPKEVVITHLFPNCKGKEDEMVAEIKKEYGGTVTVGYDLQKHVL